MTFQPILFCQSWDSWGQILLQTDRQILWHHIRGCMDFFFKLNLLPPTRFICRGINKKINMDKSTLLSVGFASLNLGVPGNDGNHYTMVLPLGTTNLEISKQLAKFELKYLVTKWSSCSNIEWKSLNNTYLNIIEIFFSDLRTLN